MQKQFVILDGALIPETSAMVPVFSSRAGKYGDGFFETINFFNHQPLYFNHHFNRMAKTARLLKFDFPAEWNQHFFESMIDKLAVANACVNGRVSIAFYRETEGYYTPKDKKFQFHISMIKAEGKSTIYDLDTKGISLGEYRELIKTSNYLSPLKTNNALIYVLAGIFAKNNQLDDCLIFNEFGRIAETVASNILLVYNDKVISPPVSEYGIDGVMKKIVMQKAAMYGYVTEEHPLYAEDLFGADEIWLTNVIKGINWVQNYKGKTYQNSAAVQMIKLLNN